MCAWTELSDSQESSGLSEKVPGGLNAILWVWDPEPVYLGIIYTYIYIIHVYTCVSKCWIWPETGSFLNSPCDKAFICIYTVYYIYMYTYMYTYIYIIYMCNFFAQIGVVPLSGSTSYIGITLSYIM